MAIIDTLFMTKTAEKPYPLGRTYLYSQYKGVPPRGTVVSDAQYLHYPSLKPFGFRGENPCVLHARSHADGVVWIILVNMTRHFRCN